MPREKVTMRKIRENSVLSGRATRADVTHLEPAMSARSPWMTQLTWRLLQVLHGHCLLILMIKPMNCASNI